MTDPRITKEMIEVVVEVIKERTGYGYGGGNTTGVALATLEAVFALLPVQPEVEWEYAAKSTEGRNIERAMNEQHARTVAAEYTRMRYFAREWQAARRPAPGPWQRVPDTNEGEK